MVVAEVPLWVVHSNNTTGNTSAVPGKGEEKAAVVAAAAAAANKTTKGKGLFERASESLLLLGDGSSGSGSTTTGGGLQKAAIYSIDVHGTKFATGGGDGTVRIWNANALFPKPQTMIKSRYNNQRSMPPPPTTTSPYNTTSSTDPPNNSNNNNNMNTTLNTLFSQQGNNQNNYESSGESSQDDTPTSSPSSTPSNSPEKGAQSVSASALPATATNDNRGDTSGSTTATLPSTATNNDVENNKNGEKNNTAKTALLQQQDPENRVHDLSNVVRRKKDDGNTATATATATTNPTTDEKRKQQSQHNNSHDTTTTNATNQNTITNTTDRLLCTLSAHTGSSVLAVRFSNNGKYLASAGDDAVVCIYAQQQTNHPQQQHQQQRGNLENTSSIVEHWIRMKVCRGHGLDAVGLAWAPDDSHLVSCSLDSQTPIIVWKVTDLLDYDDHNITINYSTVLCHPYKILGKGIHTSTVKGVTFDPAGSYLASSGDDPSVCIWRAHDDWGLEKRIDATSGIFRHWNTTTTNGNTSNTTSLSSQSLFRRLSWSTDGSYICTTNAVVKNKNVASTISREGWAVSSATSTATGAVNLVGHKQPVVAARHCPYLLNAAKTKSRKAQSTHTDSKNEEENDNDDDNGDDNNNEPEYSTLLALGDKRGFVTVWSTRKSRPIFKIQCSETRCTVTDLSWGRLSASSSSASSSSLSLCGDVMLLVSLLDGQVVALRFGIPEELGRLLTATEQARVFQLRYGIDLNEMTGGSSGDGIHGGGGRRRRIIVGDSTGPKLIENALQFSFENRHENNDGDDENNNNNRMHDDTDNSATTGTNRQKELLLSSEEVRARQSVSRSKGGKKRIQPLLMQTTALVITKKAKLHNNENQNHSNTATKKLADTLESAMELAEKAASGALAVAAAQKSANKTTTTADSQQQQQQMVSNPNNHAHQQQQQPPPNSQQQQQQQYIQQQQQQQQRMLYPPNIQLLAGAAHSTPQIPHSTGRIHSVELPLLLQQNNQNPAVIGTDVQQAAPVPRYVADCTNSSQVPKGSSGRAVPCAVLSISQTGHKLWQDQLVGSSCCALAASTSWLVVGTSDGCLQLYGTSPTLGWKSGSAFRSHPPFVLGRPIVALHLREQQPRDTSSSSSSSSPDKKDDKGGEESQHTELLVVTSDGRFAVYGIEPRFKLHYKGSLLPAMTHMLLSADLETELYLPKLARIQLTETNRLLLLLSLHSVTTTTTTAANDGGGRTGYGMGSGGGGRTGGGGGTNQAPSVGAGGSLQGFIYDVESDLWMRVADSRFVLSDFYTTLPSSSTLSFSKTTSTSKKASNAVASGELSKLDDTVRMGNGASTLQRSRRTFQQQQNDNTNDVSTNDIASRSHCEDRMACAVALGSAAEFAYWFSRYIKILALTGNESLLRLIIDLVLGKESSGTTTTTTTSSSSNNNSNSNGERSEGDAATKSSSSCYCWWLSASPNVFQYDRVNLVRTIIIPEMSKNRELQRITNEIAIEIASLRSSSSSTLSSNDNNIT